MSWLNPIALWALTALTVPILIHFWSKNKTKEIAFGSIRFLRESSTRQSKRIQLSELPLLIIRLLILICSVLLLAKWVNYEKAEKRSAVLLGDEVKVPKAYIQDQIPIFRTDGYGGDDIVNHWYLLEQFEKNQPEVDSLTYINDFTDTDFVGAIPEFNFDLKLISSKKLDKQNLDEVKSLDTLFIHIDLRSTKLAKKFTKILKANELYVEAKVKFMLAEKGSANLIITDSKQKSAVNQIILTDTISTDYLVHREHKYSILYLNRKFTEDPLQEDSFLWVVSEYMAQIIEPMYQYSSYEAIYTRSSAKEQAVQIASTFSDELLWIILFLIMLERYLSYRKQHA